MSRLRTKQQDRALARLERALAACKAAGLRIAGMESALWATDEKDLPPLDYGYPIYNDERSTKIADHGAYRGSGGW